MDTFGPGGSVIAAMMAVATGMARHVLCFRTLWEATFGQLVKEGKLAPPMSGRTTSWQHPYGATSAAHTLAQNAGRHFHRYGTTREPTCERRVEPDRHLPGPAHDGGLPVGAHHYHAVRALRL
jgi:acetyl-CoA acetyltransferase